MIETSRRIRTNRRPSAGAGFTLAEMLIALLVTSVVMAATLTVFQLHNQMARTQTQVAEMQQSLRIAQHDLVRTIRMSGRGGLRTSLPPVTAPVFPGKLLPGGVAIDVDNNVPANTRIGGPGTPRVVPNTDIVTVRGVFTAPLWQVDPPQFVVTPTSASATINYLTPAGVPQSLQTLADAIDEANDNGVTEAVVLVSPLAGDVYIVGELTGGAWTSGTSGGETIIVQASVTISFTTAKANEYIKLSEAGAFPPNMNSAAFFGILEEYRYYVREDYAIPNDNTSPLLPRLSRARFYPNTQIAHPSDPNSQQDIADNVFDLQVALGVDSDSNGNVVEGVDASARATDEWLFNHTGDVEDPANDPASWRWNSTPTVSRPLFYLRVSTVVRADRRTIDHVSTAIDRIEDRAYGEPEFPSSPSDKFDRSFRRRIMRTTVDLRNLS